MTVNELRAALADESIPGNAYVMIELSDGTRRDVGTTSFATVSETKRKGSTIVWQPVRSELTLTTEPPLLI